MGAVEDLPLVDYGRAEDVYVSGLGAVEQLDETNARLSWFVRRSQGSERVRLVRVPLIIPVRALGPAFDLCAGVFGNGVFTPIARHLHRRLLM